MVLLWCSWRPCRKHAVESAIDPMCALAEGVGRRISRLQALVVESYWDRGIVDAVGASFAACVSAASGVPSLDVRRGEGKASGIAEDCSAYGCALNVRGGGREKKGRAKVMPAEDHQSLVQRCGFVLVRSKAMVAYFLWFARDLPWAWEILECESGPLAGGEREGLVGPLTEGTAMTTGSLAKKKIEQKSVLRCDEVCEWVMVVRGG